ncbi:MAG: response regulator [Dehalococcoidia bacterium]|nr:response regulator [Dehalococcoidia bacterium]
MAGVILVVDDDHPVRVMLTRLLQAHGYTVLQAEDVKSARAVLEEEWPDLVVSDIVMPGVSGIELRRELRRRFPGLPVILTSGYSAEGPAEFAARTPDTHFVQKPFRAGQLLTLIEDVLASKRVSQE